MYLIFTFSFFMLFLLLSNLSVDKNYSEEISFKLALKAQKNEEINANRLQKESYLSSVKTLEKSESKNKSRRSPSTFQKRAAMHAGINFYSLLVDKSDQNLEKLFCTLVANVYGHSEFYYEGFEADLLKKVRAIATANDTKLNNGKQHIKNIEDLASLNLENEKMQECFYKILKGSRIGESNNGYPSLLSFLILKKNRKSLINLLDAPPEILSSLFDEKFANDFIKNKESLEKELKDKTMELEALEKIVKKYGKKIMPYRHLITLHAH